MKKVLFATLSLLFIATTSYGQKIKNIEGDAKVSFLKGQESINIIYDYEGMAVGKYDKEEDYVNDKVAERNKKEAGTGDKWKESWFGSRDRVYHMKFEQLFNKGLAKMGLTGGRDMEGTKYTLTVKTVFTEPGFNVGVMKKPSAVSFEYIFSETESGNVVARFSQQNVPGSQAMGMDFDTSTRISESYAKAGKMLAAMIYKNNK